MNQTITDLCARRSCRGFSEKQVDDETLDMILRAGTFAPTGLGKQSPIMIAVQNAELIQKLSRMNAEVLGMDTDPFYGGGTVVIVLADKTMPTYVYDGALVMGNLLNAAEALGVQSCWIHRAKEVFETAEGKKILADLGIVGDYEGIGHCVLGYGEKVPAKPRKENYIYKIK